jgi:hypothetical protein
VPKPLLSYLLPFSRTFNCTSKTTGWFTKGAEIDRTCPTLTKCYSKVAHFLYTLMDFFQSHQTVPGLSSFPERSIALKRLAGSPKAEIDPNLHANKVLLGNTHSYIHWWTSFSRKLCPSRCYLTFFPERSIALKRLAGSPKELKWSNLPQQSVLLKVARILIYIDGLLQSRKLCPSRYLTFFFNVQLH